MQTPDSPTASELSAVNPLIATSDGADHLGSATARPFLSWHFAANAMPTQGTRQVAWQVRAGADTETLLAGKASLDSGRVHSGQSVRVEWPFAPLASRERLFWQVRVWLDESEEPSAWSEPALLEAALLNQEDWRAQWIEFGADGRNDTPPSPYLRTGFTLPAGAVKARLYASALGLFEFHLNGQPVHPEAVLLPGWTDFRHRAQYLAFDVTPLLQEGSNVLGAILADGWFSGYLAGWVGDKNRHHYNANPALLAQLEVECADGSRVVILSDGSWQGRTGAILSADLYHGETYDARLEPGDWTAPQAELADESWQPVRERAWPEGLQMDAKLIELPRCVEALVPQAVTEPQKGVYVFDLGQNIAGWARLKLHGKAGQTVTLRFAEMLNADGTLYTANLRGARATDHYTFATDGEVVWEPRFTFHGFRYVELTGVQTAPEASAITGMVILSAMRETGSFECSEPLVNRLWQNIRWGLRGNFLEVPTDCPQRDERLGWTGDIQVFCKTASYLYDTDAFLTKWLRDLRDGRNAQGAYPDIAPDVFRGEHNFGNAAWADAGVIVPWGLYRRFGDLAVLEENYEAMSTWIGYMEASSRALVRPFTSYGDWLAIDAVVPGGAPVPSDFIGTAYFVRDCDIMAQVASLLEREEDAARFSDLAARVRQAFYREFVTDGGRLVGDCQTAYALALAFNLLEERHVPVALERLVELIRIKKWHLSTGFVGTPLLCNVLSRYGRHDVAMKLLLQDSYPSWLFTVKNGATTMWERWNSYTPETGFGDVGMNSFNHYAYGAVGEWMVHWLAGMAPATESPAYGDIVFRPQPSAGMSHVAANLDTPYGAASIRWRTAASSGNDTDAGEAAVNAIEGEITIPFNTSARFVPPTEDIRYTISRSDGSTVAADTRLTAGTYRFLAECNPR